MRPDTKKERRNGWLAFTAAVVIAGAAVWWLGDGGTGEARLHSALAALPHQDQGILFSQRLEEQRAATRKLAETIEELKKRVGFSVAAPFQVPKDTNEPSYLFRQVFTSVRGALGDRAIARSCENPDEFLGFGSDPKVPDDTEAAYLLTMLQLTKKAVELVLDKETQISSFKITHAKAELTGAKTRPPLLREYPLELTVTGSQRDILWLLHRFAKTKDDREDDYPLIIRGLTITSKNLKPRDDVQQLQATFKIAGMQFLTPEERAAQGGVPLAAPGSPSGGTATTKRVSAARP